MASGSCFDKRNEQAHDIMSPVRLLQGLATEDLDKLFLEPGNIVSHTTSNGILVQIDMEKLSRNLALHICATSLAWKREKSLFEYLLSAVRLLHSLYGLASKHPSIKQNLLDNVKVAEELIDLAFYLMVILCSSFTQEKGGLADLALLHSTMVACTLYLLRACTSSQWQDLSQVLLAYYKVDVFMDAAFAAVRLDIKFLGAKISSVGAGSHVDSIPKTEEMLNCLCQQSEASMQFLQSLCQQKAFRERLVKNKELCSKGGIILLAEAILSLQIPPSLENLSSLMAGVSRLKSKMLSILLHLCEAESVSYLDEVAGTPKSMELTKSIALEVLALLRRMFNRDFKHTSACSQKIYPTGQLQLNAMRLADIFSDDSNFRTFVTIHFTELLTDIFMLPHGEFLSSWCSSDLSVWEEEATVTYDPFAAAGWVLTSCSSTVPGKPLNSEYVVSSSLSQASYAHERTALLVKAIANLHCFVPDICKEEKDLFLTKFLQCLQREPSRLPDENPSTSDAEKAAIVRKNLGSLLGHAESLIPGFLNEEDVQLLRVFIRQLELHISPPRGGNHTVQEVQMTEGCSSVLLRDVAPIFNNGNGKMESTSGNYSLPEGIHFNVKSDMGQCKDFVRQEMINYRSADGHSAKAETDTQNVETSGDSSSTREKNFANQNYNVYSIPEGAVEAQIPEKVPMQQEERQHRKRKRTIMNEEQIALVEKAILDEPRLHRNASSLKLWAQRLSAHGPEVTTSQLKNWLNNRKARLARAAKDARVLSEGDNPDKQMGEFNVPTHEKSISPVDDLGVASTAQGNSGSGSDFTVRDPNEIFVIGNKMLNDLYRTGELHYEPEQPEVLVNEKAEIIEKGEVHHVLDQSHSNNLEESHPCS
ncbi:homeodomain transcription factor [Lithospermum erythrorhizon]|uniref:Homeodomain transcription factor n=1 Tax=Lithospermum erythrorhizon TaxID=34254 RepID=A0AAV3P2Q6_LITER